MIDGAVSAKPAPSELPASPEIAALSGARQSARRLADWLVGAAVVSLPWSASATHRHPARRLGAPDHH